MASDGACTKVALGAELMDLMDEPSDTFVEFVTWRRTDQLIGLEFVTQSSLLVPNRVGMDDESCCSFFA